MSKHWVFKIVIIGSPRVGKTTFIRNHVKKIHGIEIIRFGIGESLAILKENLDSDKIYEFSIWELNADSPNLFMYSNFIKGAVGCLLFFNLSNHKTFEDLSLWVKLIRKVNGNIPLILIGTKADLESQINF